MQTMTGKPVVPFCAMLFFGLLPATGAIATPGAPVDAPGVAPAAEKPDCRSQARMRTRMRTTECHTRAEWAAIDKADAEAARKFIETRPRSRGSSE